MLSTKGVTWVGLTKKKPNATRNLRVWIASKLQPSPIGWVLIFFYPAQTWTHPNLLLYRGIYTPICAHMYVFKLLIHQNTLQIDNNALNILLNCTITFFPTHCVFQELDTIKTIDTGRKRNWLYELELTFDQVVYINTSSAFEYHCRLGHPFLHVLKLLVPSLGQISFLECESCQLGKHHCVLP